ncbi:MAG: GDSL-type esterase/lipase family protein [Pirellulaceae bacterium]
MHSRGSLVWLICTLLFTATARSQPPDESWYPKAPPLPAATGEVILVETVVELFAAAEKVQPGGTILLADGVYAMPRYFELHTDDVTLRSARGDRHNVILDGTESQHGELVGVSRCSGVTIADLTIQNIKWNGFKINSDRYATRVTIRNCVIHNIWQRGVKGPAMDPRDHGKVWPTDCRIEYCLFYNDRPKEYSDDPADTPDTFGGNYVGGIDAMYAKGWTIADNVFTGIHGRTGEGRGAIFLWNESQECVVERNVIIDCDCGICLGNPYRHEQTRWHDDRCIVRNNFVTRCPETGILAAHTHDCLIVHNTVHDPASSLRRLIWIQDDNEGLVVANNLLSGPDILRTGSSEVAVRNNVNAANLTDQFVDAATGNLRLTAPMSSNCVRLPEAMEDLDGRSREEHPTPGATEYLSPAQPAPSAPRLGSDVDTPLLSSSPMWQEAMTKVQARFQGPPGYVAQFGDSITHSMAFWSPLGWDYPDKYLMHDDGLPKIPPGARWRDVIRGTRDKGPEFANNSGWRVEQLVEAVDGVLTRQQPEIAIIMIGTNDITGNQVPAEYVHQLEGVVKKCCAAGCIPILNTIPPRRDHDTAVGLANEQIREVARRCHVPLVDYHRECLSRRPEQSWDGTLISEDGVHPTAGQTHVYTAENLRNSGYALRNWLNFQMVREIYFRVLHPQPGF